MMIIGTPIKTLMSDTMITITKTFIPFIYWEECGIWSGSALFAYYRMHCLNLYDIGKNYPTPLKLEIE